MHKKRTANIILRVLLATLPTVFLSSKAEPPVADSSWVLTGSTPGDAGIKSMLGLPANAPVDFMRWELTFNKPNQQFALDLQYGLSKPNTLGFENDGTKFHAEGHYRITREKALSDAQVYQLESPQLPGEIRMIQVSSNVFHILTGNGKLMVGNGGWSYSLNRKIPSANNPSELPLWSAGADIAADTARQMIFEGRTPCTEIASAHHLNVTDGCFKLKWKLTLNRDANTFEPTTYTLNRTNNRRTNISGKWTIKQGLGGAPSAIILRLDPDKPDETISLLLGDNHVAFFLDKNNRLLVGNKDFSYTMNRRMDN